MKSTITKITLFILSSLLGAVFIYSGYTKIHPIEPFEFTFVDLGIAGWRTAPFIARFMIGLEFFIGFLLIMGLYIKRFTIKLTIASLILFTVYLLFIIATTGNNGNCGCFGTAVSMTPLQAIIKNLIMMAVSFILYKYYNGFDFQKSGKWVLGISLVSAMALPHIMNYIDFSYSEAYLTKKEDYFKLELDTLYAHASIKTPPKTLSKGKHIIAFMSLTCPHCKIAAKKLKLIKDRNPDISIYIVLNGEEKLIKPFFEETRATNIDYCILNGKSFIYLAGIELPAIFLVNNSIVENWVNYLYLEQSEIENWLAKH